MKDTVLFLLFVILLAMVTNLASAQTQQPTASGEVLTLLPQVTSPPQSLQCKPNMPARGSQAHGDLPKELHYIPKELAKSIGSQNPQLAKAASEKPILPEVLLPVPTPKQKQGDGFEWWHQELHQGRYRRLHL